MSMTQPVEEASAKVLPAGLYVVATPIGNLGDITYRAVETLRAVDLIACEDTRISSRLMAHYDITTPLTTYHDHNGAAVRPVLLAKMQAGARIALISDAGTPLVSDPGYKLVHEARTMGIGVTALPGPSALLAALAIAGLPTDRFSFLGFAPPKTVTRQTFLREAQALPGSLIFYETAKRLPGCLEDLASVMADRPVVVARELTKKFEEIQSGTPAQLKQFFEDEGVLKGEIVVLVGPAEEDAAGEGLEQLLAQALERLSLRDAVAEVSAMTGARRREVYRLALSLEAKDE